MKRVVNHYKVKYYRVSWTADYWCNRVRMSLDFTDIWSALHFWDDTLQNIEMSSPRLYPIYER